MPHDPRNTLGDVLAAFLMMVALAAAGYMYFHQ